MDEFAIFTVKYVDGDERPAVRYSRWTDDRYYAEFSGECLVARLSRIDTEVGRVEVQDRTGKVVWEMEV